MSHPQRFSPLVKRPINCEALQKAYKIENWSWWRESGRRIPSVEEIVKMISELEGCALKSKYGCCTSGGLDIQIINGEFHLRIDQMLYRHLEESKTETPITKEKNEDSSITQ